MGTTPPVKRHRRGMAQWQLETPKALRRGLGSPALFGIVQGFIAASIYFALGLVIQAALGFAWLVFLVSAAFFGLLVLSYVEGASLHQERGGATIVARYAFNELRQLHRRLGDPARLHPADRDHRVRDDGLRGGAVRARGGRAVGVLLRRGGRRRRGVASTSAAPAPSATSASRTSCVADLVLQTAIVILGLALICSTPTR